MPKYALRSKDYDDQEWGAASAFELSPSYRKLDTLRRAMAQAFKSADWTPWVNLDPVTRAVTVASIQQLPVSKELYLVTDTGERRCKIKIVELPDA